jgi:hypothetical protein
MMENKTKISGLPTIACYLTLAAFIAVMLYLPCNSIHNDSLLTDEISGKMKGVFLSAWFYCSSVSICISLIAIVSLLIKRKLTGVITAIFAIFGTLLVAALVMPTLGLAHSTIYKRKANGMAYKALNEFNQTSLSKELDGPFLLSDYEVKYEPNYNDAPRIVEVFYELKKDVHYDSFPQHFLVTLNLENAKIEFHKEKKDE